MITQEKLNEISETYPWMIMGSKFPLFCVSKPSTSMIIGVGSAITVNGDPNGLEKFKDEVYPEWYTSLEWGEGIIKTVDLLKYPEIGDTLEDLGAFTVVNQYIGSEIKYACSVTEKSGSICMNRYRDMKYGKFADPELTNAEKLGLSDLSGCVAHGLSVSASGEIVVTFMCDSFDSVVFRNFTNYKGLNKCLLPQSFLDSRLEFFPVDSIKLNPFLSRDKLEKQAKQKLDSMSYDELVDFTEGYR